MNLKEELQKKNKMFNACENLEDVRQHLLYLFKNDSTKLESLEDGKKIKISFGIIRHINPDGAFGCAKGKDWAFRMPFNPIYF